MEKVCSNCGSPIGEGEKFCTVCGTPVQIQRLESNRFCTQCGNLLKPTAKFCEVCGKEAPVEKPKKEEPEDEGPATMDELIIPEITEDTFASARELSSEKFDGFEAAVMPELEKAAPPPAPKPAPAFAMDAAPVLEQPKTPAQPTPAPAAVKQAAQPVPTPVQQAAQPVPVPAQQTAQPLPTPVQQTAQPAFTPSQTPPAQPANSVPNEKVTNGNKKIAIPLILAVCILIVLIVDIVLFANKDKDGAEENISAAYSVSDIENI